MILVAPECRDTARSARSCHGTWLMRIFYKDKKRCMEVKN
jgi:hypothetical protein